MTNAPANLQSLFAELVKAHLNGMKVSLPMLLNTIDHFHQMPPFNKFKIEFWHTVCAAHEIKFTN